MIKKLNFNIKSPDINEMTKNKKMIFQKHNFKLYIKLQFMFHKLFEIQCYKTEII